MVIGQKVVVHKVEFPDLEDKLDLFKVITLTEIKDVPGHFSRKIDYKGYKAKDDSGKEYTMYWDSFPDDAANPVKEWVDVNWKTYKNIEDALWYDVIQVSDMVPVYSKPIWIKDQFENLVGYCDIHKCNYYKKQNVMPEDSNPQGIAFSFGCFQCSLDKLYPNRQNKRIIPERSKLGNYFMRGWFE